MVLDMPKLVQDTLKRRPRQLKRRHETEAQAPCKRCMGSYHLLPGRFCSLSFLTGRRAAVVMLEAMRQR